MNLIASSVPPWNYCVGSAHRRSSLRRCMPAVSQRQQVLQLFLVAETVEQHPRGLMALQPTGTLLWLCVLVAVRDVLQQLSMFRAVEQARLLTWVARIVLSLTFPQLKSPS